MKNKKRVYRKITRMLVALLCCFPVFLVIEALLNGASDFLVTLCNMVVGGIILFVVFLVGESNDEKRDRLHEEHQDEINQRKRIERLSKGNHTTEQEEDTDSKPK